MELSRTIQIAILFTFCTPLVLVPGGAKVSPLPWAMPLILYIHHFIILVRFFNCSLQLKTETINSSLSRQLIVYLVTYGNKMSKSKQGKIPLWSQVVSVLLANLACLQILVMLLLPASNGRKKVDMRLMQSRKALLKWSLFSLHLIQ